MHHNSHVFVALALVAAAAITTFPHQSLATPVVVPVADIEQLQTSEPRWESFSPEPLPEPSSLLFAPFSSSPTPRLSTSPRPSVIAQSTSPSPSLSVTPTASSTPSSPTPSPSYSKRAFSIIPSESPLFDPSPITISSASRHPTPSPSLSASAISTPSVSLSPSASISPSVSPPTPPLPPRPNVSGAASSVRPSSSPKPSKLSATPSQSVTSPKSPSKHPSPSKASTANTTPNPKVTTYGIPLRVELSADRQVDSTVDSGLRARGAARTASKKGFWVLQETREIDPPSSARWIVIRQSNQQNGRLYLLVYHAMIPVGRIDDFVSYVHSGELDKSLSADNSIGPISVRMADTPVILSAQGRAAMAKRLSDKYPPKSESNATTILQVTLGVIAGVAVIGLSAFGIVKYRRRSQSSLQPRDDDELHSNAGFSVTTMRTSINTMRTSATNDDRFNIASTRNPRGPSAIRHQANIIDWRMQAAAEFGEDHTYQADDSRLIETTDASSSTADDLESVSVSEYNSNASLTDTESVPHNSFVNFSNF